MIQLKVGDETKALSTLSQPTSRADGKETAPVSFRKIPIRELVKDSIMSAENEGKRQEIVNITNRNDISSLDHSKLASEMNDRIAQ